MTEAAPDYGSFVEAPKSEDLQQLSVLIGKLHDAEMQVVLAEEELKKRQSTVRTLAEIEIPELMTRMGVKKFSTTNSLEVEVKDDVRASIKEADRPMAFAWLDEHGHAGLIKSEVVVAFARAEADKALVLQTELSGKYPGNVRQDQWIEAPTLKKFVREQLEKSVKLPEELFGVKKFKIAKVKDRSK